jgi:hypothetical protein
MSLDENLAPAGPYAAAVEFETLSDSAKTELEAVLEECARGPAQLAAQTTAQVRPDSAPSSRKLRPAPELDPPETRAANLTHDVGVEVDVQLTPALEAPAEAELSDTPDSEPQTSEANAETDTAGSERRSGQRVTYERRIPAFGERAMRVLVARDLSMGGMRVQHESGLQIGDRLHLAIYGAADEEPFLVWASVDRDDGELGLMLAFDPVPPAVARQLDQVVVNLPAVESLHDDEARAMGTVVTEILVG